MATLPSALSLASIADGSPIIAADPRNNFAAIQTDVNALLTILGAGTNLQVLQSGGGTTVNWGGAYSSYVPVWAASGVAPVLGNGTIVGGYLQIGKLVQGQIVLTMGSTTTFGTGSYSFSLPVAPLTTNVLAGLVNTVDASPAQGFVYAAQILASTVIPVSMAAPAVAMTNTNPITFAVSDQIIINFSYQAS